MWIGNIRPEKGTILAINAAKTVNAKLIIVGPVDEKKPKHYNYWLKKVKPLVDGDQIVYLGNCSRKKTAKIVALAQGLLNPILWKEPFGLVMIEAMATGTPVIAFRKGDVSEIIKDGKTGFIVDNLKEMTKSMQKVKQLSRKECRSHVLNNYTPKIMTDKYEKLYKSLIR